MLLVQAAGRRSMTLPHRGEIVLILATVSPVSSAVGEGEIESVRLRAASSAQLWLLPRTENDVRGALGTRLKTLSHTSEFRLRPK